MRPLHNCAPPVRGLRAAGAAWRWGSSPAARSAVTAPQACPPRSRRASFHGRRQVGPTGQNAVLGVRRHLSTRARWDLGRTRTFHVGSDQASHKSRDGARGKHALACARSAFRTCAVGCESPCIGACVGPARAPAHAKAAASARGVGTSIPSPAGGLRAAGLSFIGLPGLDLRYAALFSALRGLSNAACCCSCAPPRCHPGPCRSHHHLPSPGRPPASISTLLTRPSAARARFCPLLVPCVHAGARSRVAPRATDAAARVAGRAAGAAGSMAAAWAAAEAAPWQPGWAVAAL